MPGAMKSTVLDMAHSSCKQVLAQQPWVGLGPDATIQAFVQQLQPEEVKAAAAKARALFPLKFDSQEAEVTFIALYHLLDFGSGYDPLLRASGAKRGWRETMQYGCFGLALGAQRLDGAWMRAFTPYTLHTAFGIDSKVEKELQPGITISQPGPLAPLVQSIQQAIVDTGNALAAAGAKSLGALILGHVEGIKASGKPVTAASLVEELADCIPGFQDSANFAAPGAGVATAAAAAGDTGAAAAAAAAAGAPAGAGGAGATSGQPEAEKPAAGTGGNGEGSSSGGPGSSFKVAYLRKAQALAAALQARFGGEDGRFAWTDAASLTADSGPVLPAVLQRLGLLCYSEPLSTTLQQHQQQLPLGMEERALRAAGVAAVDAIVAAAAAAAAAGGGGSGSGSSAAAAAAPFTAWELSCFLLDQVEEGEGQGGQPPLTFQGAALHPHLTTGTTAY